MISDYAMLTLRTITTRKLRSFLTVLGILVGIAAVVSLISLGEGLQKAIDKQFEAVGGDRIAITPGGIAGTASGLSALSSAKLYQDDLDVVLKVRGVEDAMGMIMKSKPVEYHNSQAFTSIFAVPTDSQSINFINDFDYFVVEEGRQLKSSDQYKAVVGIDTGPGLFDKTLKPGDKIIIAGAEFEIVGINKKAGNPFHDRKIVIPLDIGREILEVEGDEFSSIAVKTEKGFEPSEVADTIKKDLRKHRDVEEGEEDFSVETSEAIIESFKNVISIVQTVLVGIAAISLIVGGLGIMTTMYTSVLERTRQIGIMKSVGARNSDILAIFLIEAGFLGVVGGILGVIVGIIISYGVEWALVNLANNTLLKAYFPIELILGAIGFSFLVGCMSGFLPSWRASKMNPVDALRYRSC